MTKRLTAVLAALLAAFLFLASNAWGSYLQNQPRHTGECGEYASSNAVNWITGANTTGREIFRAKKFRWYHTADGASYHTGKRDLVKAVARANNLDVQKFAGENLSHGFEAAREAMPAGGAVIMLVKRGKLTGGGHFVMGYRYNGSGDKIAVSDSNRLNPDKTYSISWLLNPAKGHVVKIWVLS